VTIIRFAAARAIQSLSTKANIDSPEADETNSIIKFWYLFGFRISCLGFIKFAIEHIVSDCLQYVWKFYTSVVYSYTGPIKTCVYWL